MKKIASVAGWMAALMVACCPCTAEMSVQDGHVYGQKEIDGKRIVYDFDVPKEGNVHYDLILKNDSPTSLIINGNEYVK